MTAWSDQCIGEKPAGIIILSSWFTRPGAPEGHWGNLTGFGPHFGAVVQVLVGPHEHLAVQVAELGVHTGSQRREFIVVR